MVKLKEVKIFPSQKNKLKMPWRQSTHQKKALLSTVGQNSQEYRLKYWATRSSLRSFARTAHSFACSTLLTSLTRSAALTRSLARLLTSLTPSLVGHWLVRWLFILCFFFHSGPQCSGELMRKAYFDKSSRVEEGRRSQKRVGKTPLWASWTTFERKKLSKWSIKGGTRNIRRGCGIVWPDTV